MGVQTTINGMNVGEDVSLTLIANPGGTFPAEALGHLTKVDLKYKYKHIEQETITNDGITLQESKPMGVSLSMTVVRANGAVAQLHNQYRQNWFNGIRTDFSLQMKIRNRDGSVDSYLLVGGKPTDGSKDIEPGKNIPQNMSFEFQDAKLNGVSVAVLQAP